MKGKQGIISFPFREVCVLLIRTIRSTFFLRKKVDNIYNKKLKPHYSAIPVFMLIRKVVLTRISHSICINSSLIDLIDSLIYLNFALVLRVVLVVYSSQHRQLLQFFRYFSNKFGM